MVIVTGQGAAGGDWPDAFQEPFMALRTHCQALVCSAQPKDMARIVAEAFYIASTGRPGRY